VAEESTRRPARRQPQGRAVGEASQEVREAERIAATAAGVAGEASREARQAERGATIAAEMAVAAVQEVEAEREAAVLTQQMLLTPTQLRSLIAGLVEAIQAPSIGAPPVGNALDAEQQSLALRYDAYCTMVARHGAASIALYQLDGDYIKVEQRLGEGSSVIVYGRPTISPDQPVAAIGRAPLKDGSAFISGLRAIHIDRVEILDANGRPVLLGLPGAFTRTGHQPHLDQE
jgi:hypothetical protein